MKNSNFHFTVKLKLIIGFGILGILLVVMYRILSDTQKEANLNSNTNLVLNYPSMRYSEDLKDLIMNSQFLVTKWTLKGDRDTKLATELESCHGERYDSLKSKIVGFVDNDLWNDKNKELYFKLTSTIDTLFSLQSELVDNLNSTEKFNDATNYSFRKYSVLDGEIANCYKRAFQMASRLSSSFYKVSKDNLADMNDNYQGAENVLKLSVTLFFVLMVLIAFIMGKSLVGSVNYVKDKIVEMSEGILPEVKVLNSNDEIGQMSKALNSLVSNLKETSQFAIKIGEGNFSSENTTCLQTHCLSCATTLSKPTKKPSNEKLKTLNVTGLHKVWRNSTKCCVTPATICKFSQIESSKGS